MKIILQFYKYGLFLLLVVLNSPAFSQYLDFKRYSLEQGLSLTQTTDLLQLDNGYLVVGTYGEGLNFFNGSKFTEFDKEDGLSDDYVYSLLLDDDGKVWIGTSNGLNVFDGKSFTVYTSQEGLSDNAIWSLAKLNDQILIGTEYGITIYNKSDEKFSQINNEDINNSVIWDMYYGADNVLYIGTDNGLYTAEEGNLSNIKKTDDFNTLMIYKITQDSDTNLLLGSSNGVYIQTGNTFKNITNKNGLPDNEIYDIKEEEKGMFWIGSYKGLSKIVDGKVAFVSPRFQNNSIWTIIYDNEQNLWISGDDGLYILKNDNFIAFGNQYDRKISAWEIDQTKDGRIYAATQNEGIQILDGNKFYPAPYNEEFSKEIFNSIAEKDGMMYYGSETGLYRYDGTNVAKLMPPDGYKSIDVLNLFNDSQNTLWIGSGYSGIFFLKNNEIKSLSEVSDLYMGSLNAALEDKSGTLWFATSYGLFYRDSTGEFKQSDLLKNSDVISLLEDSRGNFWASIYDQGVVFIDRTNNISDTISADDGLNHISILSTVIDNQGYLWIGTNHGLNRFDLEKYYESKEIDILAYSIKDGFPGSELVENTLLVDNDGFIWYASVAGIIRFNPKEIEPVHYSPPIYITSISINNRPYKEKESINLLSEKIIVKDKIELPSFDAALSLSFQAVSYYEAEKLKYSYRMSDGEWSEPTERNYVDYYNLSPGTYTFEVAVLDNRGVRENSTSVMLIVPSPFWKTYWFYLLIILFMVSAAYLFYRMRTRKIKLKNKELEKRIKEREEYEQQLRASRDELLIAKEKAEASEKLKMEFLAQMSHEIRTPVNSILSYTNLLKEAVGNSVPDELKDSFVIIDNGGRRLIRTIDSILNMSQFQSGHYEINPKELNLQKVIEDLTAEFCTAAEDKKLKLTTKVLTIDSKVVADEYSLGQLFANLIDNAIKYTKKGDIEIKIYREYQKLIVDVKDTGIGISEEYIKNIFNPFTQEETGYSRRFEGTGLGLALVKKYAEVNNAKIAIESIKGNGTIFRVIFEDKSEPD